MDEIATKQSSPTSVRIDEILLVFIDTSPDSRNVRVVVRPHRFCLKYYPASSHSIVYHSDLEPHVKPKSLIRSKSFKKVRISDSVLISRKNRWAGTSVDNLK
jgi:hypothetical protein